MPCHLRAHWPTTFAFVSMHVHRGLSQLRLPFRVTQKMSPEPIDALIARSSLGQPHSRQVAFHGAP